MADKSFTQFQYQHIIKSANCETSWLLIEYFLAAERLKLKPLARDVPEHHYATDARRKIETWWMRERLKYKGAAGWWCKCTCYAKIMCMKISY
jgi:hypothetical protein